MPDLEKCGYRFIGRHSAIKICEWARSAIRGKSFCYKQKFYGIQSHRCIQMSPAGIFLQPRLPVLLAHSEVHAPVRWRAGQAERNP